MRPTFDGFTVVLLRQCVLTPKQLEHAMAVQRQRGIPFREALIQLGYATVQQVWRALAAYHGLTLVDLTGVVVPPAILNLVPESVAREIVCLPLAEAAGALTIALSEPDELADTLAKLRVLLNREIHLVLAVRAQLQEAIRTHYGSAPTESVNAMRTEPTDSRSESCEDGFPQAKLRIQESGRYLGKGIVEFKKGLKGLDDELVERRATIRYYDRMNPLRMFPLLVVLSKEAIAAVVQRHVGQNESQRFQVALDSVVEIEPILPGCQCYPPRELLTIRPQDVTAKFWVVPQVLGQIRHARVVVRQQGKQLANVPLEIRVVRHGLTLLTGALSLVVPFVVLLLKRFRLDFDSQVEDGFGLYAQLANWVLESVTPGGLAGLLLALTAILYFSLRPRKRDVFWDLQPAPAGQASLAILLPAPSPERFTPAQPPVDPEPACQRDLFLQADLQFRKRNYRHALRLYAKGLEVGKASLSHYARAALAAGRLGEPGKALRLLQDAEHDVGPERLRASMWYHMGCFATRLGRYREAVEYFRHAAEAGFAGLTKWATDPDLAPLRGRADFQDLLSFLDRQRAAG